MKSGMHMMPGGKPMMDKNMARTRKRSPSRSTKREMSRKPMTRGYGR